MTRPGSLGRDAAFDFVHANLLDGFVELFGELGGNAAAFLEGFGVVVEPGSGQKIAATYGQAIDLLAAAAQTLACPDFGMRLAARQAGTGVYGPLGTVMRNSKTLGDALDFVISHSHVHSPAARITRRPVPGHNGALFSHELLVGGFALQEQAIEQVLLAGHLGAMAITGGKARVRRVLFRHHAISSEAVYRRHFGCDVLFDQTEDAVVFGESDLASVIVDSDPAIHAGVVAMIAERFPRHAPPLYAATRGAVLRALQDGNGSNADVAAEMGMHTRTLHRHLQAQGTTFQGIKDEVRCEVMRYYVEQTDLSFTWIAGKLGFSEQSVMTRFCRRYLGMPPTELRANAGRGGCTEEALNLAGAAEIKTAELRAIVRGRLQAEA